MDIDIDLSPIYKPEALFPQTIKASMVENGELKKHPVGLYFQTVPIDQVTGLAAIPYKDAESNSLFKIDMINVNMLAEFDGIFDNKKQMRDLTKIPPDWSMLEDPEIIKNLFHIGKHADVITKIKPRSISELADCLSIIRPSKRHLIDKYVKDRKDQELLTELYTKRDKSDFRRSHAVPYALLIVIQLHLIKEGLYDI